MGAIYYMMRVKKRKLKRSSKTVEKGTRGEDEVELVGELEGEGDGDGNGTTVSLEEDPDKI